MDTIVGLCGSLRAASFNRKLMHQAASLYGDCTFHDVSLDLPLFNGDLQDRGMPAAVTALADAIKAADGIIIASPEYNKGISGVLKNALDWISRVEGSVLAHKPTAIVSAAAGRTGGETAQYHTRHCLTPLGADVIATPAICIAGAQNEFNAQGVMENPRYIANLATLMTALSQRIAAQKL